MAPFAYGLSATPDSQHPGFMMTHEFQRAHALHSQGKRYFNAGFYAEAELNFREAVGAVNVHHDYFAVFKLDLAKALQMVRRYDGSVGFRRMAYLSVRTQCTRGKRNPFLRFSQ